MNCKDFKIEVEAGLRDTRLSVSAEEHSAQCSPCQAFNQKHVEFREWLTVCQKITAPKNFQFGVQRKITEASGANAHYGLWRGLGYIVPSAAAITVLVLAISYFTNYQNVTITGSTATMSNSDIGNPQPAQENGPGTSTSVAVQQGNVTEEVTKPENEKLATATNSGKQENTPRPETPGGGTLDSKGGGSIAQGVGNSKPSELPEGIHLPPSKALDQSSTQRALQQLGVITGMDNGAIKVTLLTKPSAERAGVKKGDIVQSLNGNVLTVNRGGQTMQITLK